MDIQAMAENNRRRKTDKLLKMVGDKLRILRINRGFTQQDVADKCMCNRQTIQKIERGSPGVSITFLFSYLVALNQTRLLDSFNDLIPYPIYLKPTHTIKFRQRVKKVKIKNGPRIY